MVAIPYFSTEAFYRSVTGAPLDSSVGWGLHDIAIPPDGVHFIPTKLRGESTQQLLRILERAQHERKSLITSIACGDIPPVITPSTTPTSGVSIVYLPLRDLVAQDITVAELLGAIPRLAKVAIHATSTICPLCAAPSPTLRSAGDLATLINTKHADREISLAACGPTEAMALWATKAGFSLQNDTAGESLCILDSLRCSIERLHALTPLMRSALHHPLLHVEVRHDKGRDYYALSGFCSSCRRAGSPLRERMIAQELSKTVPNPECGALFRDASGYPLYAAARVPLRELQQLPDYQPILSPDQWDAIECLGGLGASLATPLSQLAPHTLAALVLATTLTSESGGPTLRVFDAPLSVFSKTESSAAISLAQKRSQTIPLLWISPEPSAIQLPPPLLNRSASDTALLGSLQIKRDSEHAENFELRPGSTIEARRIEGSSTTRLAREIANALDTNDSLVCSFNREREISTRLIPLHPPLDKNSLLVAHALDLFDPLAILFAASHQARMLGITPRTLAIGPTKRNPALCSGCFGLGLTIDGEATHPCHGCWGTRYRSPYRSITFRGKTFWEYLNAPLSANEGTLRALPKRSTTLDLASHLRISHIPLGTPLRALPQSERRLISIAKEVLAATSKRPTVMILEEPFCSLSTDEAQGLKTVMEDPFFGDRVCWVVVS